ncbi:S1C family serine protease [Planctomicrobium sp. SH661]|uniref:S1C family serine protease n=1 Tax=Planctomicrobium sp. SH661 TaxID=3448124 RepID=UPI003F5B5224
MSPRTLISKFLQHSLLVFAIASVCWHSSAQGQEAVEPLGDGEILTGQRMRYAFREVVRQASEWTVSVRADGKQVALGTVVGDDGWILTKASQINKATQVQLADGRQFPIDSVRHYQKLDLALLKINATDLKVVLWEKKDPEAGVWMITSGMAPDFVIGVGVLSAPRYQVPRSDTHGYLGVELTGDQLPKIKKVFANSGASNAGLKEGDLVLEIDQRSITTSEQLMKTLKGYRPGDTLSLRVRRSEEEFAYSVTLMHQYGDFLSRMAFQNQMGGELSYRRDDFEAVYQHDSVIGPEECGGPVVNLDGLAMGINIARAGRTETYALPADLIEPLIEQLKQGTSSPLPTSEVQFQGPEAK